MIIYDRNLTQGTFDTASILLPKPKATVTALAKMPNSAKSDPGLTIRYTLFVGSRPPNEPSKPLNWVPVAEADWTGGSNTYPSLTWTGSGYRARIRCEVSKPTYIDWTANAVPVQ